MLNKGQANHSPRAHILSADKVLLVRNHVYSFLELASSLEQESLELWQGLYEPQVLKYLLSGSLWALVVLLILSSPEVGFTSSVGQPCLPGTHHHSWHLQPTNKPKGLIKESYRVSYKPGMGSPALGIWGRHSSEPWPLCTFSEVSLAELSQHAQMVPLFQMKAPKRLLTALNMKTNEPSWTSTAEVCSAHPQPLLSLDSRQSGV